MDTMTITVGDFKLVLPSSARVPGVNVRPDAIELDFVGFSGKLAISLPGAPSKDGRSQSLESMPGAGSPGRCGPQISSHNQPLPAPPRSIAGFGFDADGDLGDESVHTPLPPSPARPTLSDLLHPDASQPSRDPGMTQPLQRASPPPDLPLTPAWSAAESAGMSQRIREAADRGTQAIPRDFSYNNHSSSQISGQDDIEPKKVHADPVPDENVPAEEAIPKHHSAQKVDDCPTQKVQIENCTPRKKKRKSKSKHSPGVKRKRSSPSKIAQSNLDSFVKKPAAQKNDEKEDGEKCQQTTSSVEPQEKMLPVSPVRKGDEEDSESVPAGVTNVVNEGKRVRFHAAEASSPMSAAPITVPTHGKNPWSIFKVEAEDEGAEPIRRWGSTLTRIDEESAILLGGESESAGFFKEMTHLDLHGKAWNRSRDTPDMIGGGRAWHTTTLVGNCLLVFGGEVERKGKRVQTNDCIFYDTSYFSWYNGQIVGTPPLPRAGHATALLPGSKDLVVFGGITGKRWLSDLHRLSDLAHWSPVKGSSKRIRPSARSYASLTTLSDFVVLFGGNNKSQCFNDVHLLKPDLSWMFPIVEGRAPKPRTGHSAVATEDGKSVIVYGGWDDQGLHRLFYSDVWKLTVHSATNCEWKCIYSGDDKSKTPGPRAGAALCAAIGKKAYLFGGWHQISYFNDVLELDTGI